MIFYNSISDEISYISEKDVLFEDGDVNYDNRNYEDIPVEIKSELRSFLIQEDYQESNLIPNNKTKCNSEEQHNIIEENLEKDDESTIKEKDNNTNFLNKKRKIREIFKIEKGKKFNKAKGTKRGRKNYSDKTEHPHNNKSTDNMINKIKVYFINHYLRVLINQNFEDKSKEILKLNHKSIKCLNQNINLELFNKTLKNLFLQSDISDKYKHDKYKDINKIVIKQIYNGESQEEKVKKY